MFVTMVAANVSVLVVGSIPTGIALRAKLFLRNMIRRGEPICLCAVIFCTVVSHNGILCEQIVDTYS